MWMAFFDTMATSVCYFTQATPSKKSNLRIFKEKKTETKKKKTNTIASNYLGNNLH